MLEAKELYFYLNGYFDAAIRKQAYPLATAEVDYLMGFGDGKRDEFLGNVLPMWNSAEPFLDEPDGTVILCIRWIGNDSGTGLPGISIYTLDPEPESEILTKNYPIYRYRLSKKTAGSWIQQKTVAWPIDK